MAETPKKPTRGVFAGIIRKPTASTPGTVLLSWRKFGPTAGQVCLIGGGQDDGEDDVQTLSREAKEEAKIQIRIGVLLGGPLVFGQDTAVCYLAEILSGQPQPTDEALYHRFCTEEEVRQGYWLCRHQDQDALDEGIGMTSGYSQEPIRIVGPKDKLGRTGRMIWDALSLFHPPEESPNPNTIYPGLDLSEDGLWIVDTSDVILRRYRRLDPYTASGYMEPAVTG
ncbi:MAG: NUDIX domain-containing protein [Candidatus Peribacteraceae bacterium]|nr:NUDIX domain-containing protein [Candidatus Peribacteraceae bacterium]